MQYTYNTRDESRNINANGKGSGHVNIRLGDPPELNGADGFELSQARMEMGIAIVKNNADS